MPKSKPARHRDHAAPVVTAEQQQALLERLRAVQEQSDPVEALAALGEALPMLATVAPRLSPEEAEPVLVAASGLARTPRFADAAIAVLIALRSPSAVEALRAVAAEATDKTVLKAARRGLHQLASQGVANTAPPVPAGTAVFRPPTEGVAWQRALTSPVSADGGRSLFLAQATLPIGGAISLALLDERQGLFFFEYGRPTHRQLEKQWENFQTPVDDGEPRMTEIPFGYAQWLLAEAAERRAAGGAEPLDDYVHWQEAVGPAPEGTSPRLIYDELEVDPTADNDLALGRGATLLDQPELEGWALPFESYTPYGVELLQARNSPIVMSEAAQSDREHAVFSRAAREQVTPEWRQRLKRRLEETALIFARTDRLEQARAALATAAALGQEGRDLGSVPFIIALVRRAVEAAAEVAAPASEAGREAMSRLYAGRE